MESNRRLDSAERAREKAVDRSRDRQALASGEKSREQLHVENGAFAFSFSSVRLDFSRMKHPR